MELDILLAHPLKHHVFNLAVGCQNTGLDIKLITPVYKKSWLKLLSFLPGSAGKKLDGYHYVKLESKNVITPLYWQLRRLLSKEDVANFQEAFDCYVANQITKLKFKPKVLVTLQDYMPRTVQAAKDKGILIWSDQILNRSLAARNILKSNLIEAGLKFEDKYSEIHNTNILENASLVTAACRYTVKGIADRVNKNCLIKIIEYGVDESKFCVMDNLSNDKTIKIVARANSVRKGGHILIDALANIGTELITAANNKQIEITIIGALDTVVSKKLASLHLPEGISICSKIIPNTQMPVEFSKSQLFLMPSLSEGMSLMCVEAMQMGLPMLITEECGVDCFIDGEMGVEIKPSVESISEALLYAFNHQDKWNAWGDKCIEKAKLLTWDIYETKIKNAALTIING